MNEREQLRATRELLQILLALLLPEESRALSAMTRALDRLDSGTFEETDLDAVFEAMTSMERVFSASVREVLSAGWGGTFQSWLTRFERRGMPRVKQIDIQALDSIIRRAVASYSNASERGKASIRATFKAATGTGPLRTDELANVLVSGLIDEQTADEIARHLAERLDLRILDTDRLAAYRSRVMRAYARELERNRNLDAALRAALTARKRELLRDGKLLQIIDKNGLVRTYRASVYADLVTSTELGQAQVDGVRQAGKAHGFSKMRVTSHNTRTLICKPHEGKIYDADDDENLPLYHARCRHRTTVHIEYDDWE